MELLFAGIILLVIGLFIAKSRKSPKVQAVPLKTESQPETKETLTAPTKERPKSSGPEIQT